MTTPLHHPDRRRAQRGASMLFAIMTLVVMSLASVALVRSVDVGTLIAGNLSFKQDATAAAGLVTAEAVAALDQRRLAGLLDVDDPAQGYYASSLENLDPTGGSTSAANPMAVVDWRGDGGCSYVAAANFTDCVQAKLGTPVRGSTVRWVITRLCKDPAVQSPTNPCAKPPSLSTSTASDRGALNMGGRISGATASPYYRIVVRTEGARNTVSFTEVMVHF
jgi:type IV pilus assembly protein PilX